MGHFGAAVALGRGSQWSAFGLWGGFSHLLTPHGLWGPGCQDSLPCLMGRDVPQESLVSSGCCLGDLVPQGSRQSFPGSVHLPEPQTRALPGF